MATDPDQGIRVDATDFDMGTTSFLLSRGLPVRVLPGAPIPQLNQLRISKLPIRNQRVWAFEGGGSKSGGKSLDECYYFAHGIDHVVFFTTPMTSIRE
jgi:hypothetical protein